jgi:hypothetical protein
MNSMRLDSKEKLGSAWGGVREERELPQRYGGAGVAGAETASVSSGGRDWRRLALRFMRETAIGFALLALVPIGLVAVLGGGIYRFSESTRERVAEAAKIRPLMLAADPSISPQEAGRAFRDLQDFKSPLASPIRESRARPERKWESLTVPLTPKMFAAARPARFRGPSSSLIIAAVAKGFTPDEMTYLKTVAESPVWTEFDLVARAPAVDMIGGLYTTPFPNDASILTLPVVRFAGTKELAYANASRAAYYLAIGQPERAEQVLRGTVSFGFALIDNGANTLDALIGRIVVEIGRSNLEQLDVARGMTRNVAHDVAPPASNVKVGTAASATRTQEQFRQRLVATSEDPSLPRSLRYSALRALSTSTCSNVRDLLFGPRADVKDAFRRAKADLARYPSERAYVDLVEGGIERLPSAPVRPGSEQFIVGASTVAGAVLNNPRMATCTRAILGIIP